MSPYLPVTHREPTPVDRALGATIAVAATGAAVVLALVLRPVVFPLLPALLLLAVAGTALAAGLWPALLAALLSALALNYWFFPPARALGLTSSTDLIQQLVLLTGSVLTAVFVAQARLGRRKAAVRAGAAEDSVGALDASRAGTWEWEVDSGRFQLSTAAREMHRVRSAGAIELDELLEAIHPADRERMRSTLARSASDGSDYALEYRVPHGGSCRVVIARGRLVGDGVGSARRLIGVAMLLPEPDLPAPADPPNPPPEPAVEQRMVLVIETDAAARQRLTQAFEREDWRWLSAGDAAEALLLLERYDILIDLVVTDVEPADPGEDELVDYVRSRYAEVPIVYSSELLAGDSGADGMAALIRQVRAHLGPRDHRRGRQDAESLAVSPPEQ
ncbi:MAG: DUF4118 domain-containing protein [Gemmatimonadales bacterium]|nr:DUF4118 domain-containing protein [Gemmatimonadales bacterium]